MAPGLTALNDMRPFSDPVSNNSHTLDCIYFTQCSSLACSTFTLKKPQFLNTNSNVHCIEVFLCVFIMNLLIGKQGRGVRRRDDTKLNLADRIWEFIFVMSPSKDTQGRCLAWFIGPSTFWFIFFSILDYCRNKSKIVIFTVRGLISILARGDA